MPHVPALARSLCRSLCLQVALLGCGQHASFGANPLASDQRTANAQAGSPASDDAAAKTGTPEAVVLAPGASAEAAGTVSGAKGDLAPTSPATNPAPLTAGDTSSASMPPLPGAPTPQPSPVPNPTSPVNNAAPNSPATPVPTSAAPVPPATASSPSSGSTATSASSGTVAALPPGTPCSATYSVPATSNPYLAGAAAGTTLNYATWVTDQSNPIDTAPAESPVLVIPASSSCLSAGQVLSFTVSGTITYNPNVAGTNADGDLSFLVQHDLGAVLGKSNITAPINSLLGVFLSASDPSLQPAPAALDFSTQAARDYQMLAPAIGQVFFIGTGVTSQGPKRQVTVPVGATRLFFAVMDDYQWNNNVGVLTGAINAD